MTNVFTDALRRLDLAATLGVDRRRAAHAQALTRRDRRGTGGY